MEQQQNEFAKEYKERLLKEIKPWCKPAGYDHVVTRCKYCSDSKSMNHGHFYISIPNDDEPSMFYCQKCHVGGIVTSSILAEWGTYDANLNVSIAQYNKRVLGLAKNKIYKDRSIYRINNTSITNDELTQYKLKYISDRLGIPFTIQDCIDNKVVLNLKDLMQQNNLTPTRDQRIVDSLDAGFIGFLSYDNAFINMRNLGIRKDLHQSIDRRYINYNIFNKFNNTMKTYILPAQLNLLDPNPIELHMAEGPFDVLSIKYNVVKSDYNKIYAGILGSGYKGVIKFAVTQFKIPNIVIHIYMDSDQHVEDIFDQELRDFMVQYRIRFFVHRNISPGQKDHGVPADKIIDSVEEIKVV